MSCLKFFSSREVKFLEQVRGIGKTFDSLGKTVFEELETLDAKLIEPSSTNKRDSTYSVYFESVGKVDDTPVYLLPSLEVGDVIQGPAMIIDDTQTIVVIPGAEVTVTTNHLYIKLDS